MSYGSILDVAMEEGVDLQEYRLVIQQQGALDESRQERLDRVYITAWQRDLPLGIDFVTEMVDEHRRGGGVVTRDVDDPSSDLGKQLIRLFAADEARHVIQRYFGVSTGFYNCCSPSIGPEGTILTNPIDQILMQDKDKEHC